MQTPIILHQPRLHTDLPYLVTLSTTQKGQLQRRLQPTPHSNLHLTTSTTQPNLLYLANHEHQVPIPSLPSSPPPASPNPADPNQHRVRTLTGKEIELDIEPEYKVREPFPLLSHAPLYPTYTKKA